MRMLMTLMVLASGMAMAQTATVPGSDVKQTDTQLNDAAAQAASASKGKTGEAPIDTPIANRDGDTSVVASPVAAGRVGSALRVGAVVQMKMVQAVSSGTQRNGDTVRGALVRALRTTSGKVLPVGTPVEATVVSSAKAGVIASGGVLSLQLTKVGGVHVITDVLDFKGQEGHKDLADAAPGKGGEAMVQVGAPLTFHVMEQGKATGLVKGVAPAQGAEKGSHGIEQVQSVPGVAQPKAGGATQGVVPPKYSEAEKLDQLFGEGQTQTPCGHENK